MKVWDLETGTLVHTLEGHRSEIYALAVNRDGTIGVSAAHDHTLKVWNLKTGREIISCVTEAEVPSLTFSSDGKEVHAGLTHHFALELDQPTST